MLEGPVEFKWYSEDFINCWTSRKSEGERFSQVYFVSFLQFNSTSFQGNEDNSRMAKVILYVLPEVWQLGNLSLVADPFRSRKVPHTGTEHYSVSDI